LKLQKIVALAAAWSLVAGPVLAGTKVAEGTEFPMRLEEALSSKHAQEGDRFTVSLVEDVKLADGTVLRAGYRGVGEVVEARDNGMLGKTGKLNVRLSYLKVGDERIRLRASKAAQGDHRTGTQVVTFVFLGVFAGFIKGKNVTIPKGAQIMAYADEDKDLPTPRAAPPAEL
jgi:hypothetical protein